MERSGQMCERMGSLKIMRVASLAWNPKGTG
jgi:hypothetical protein